jgi:hypothetical protein
MSGSVSAQRGTRVTFASDYVVYAIDTFTRSAQWFTELAVTTIEVVPLVAVFRDLERRQAINGSDSGRAAARPILSASESRSMRQAVEPHDFPDGMMRANLGRSCRRESREADRRFLCIAARVERQRVGLVTPREPHDER